MQIINERLNKLISIFLLVLFELNIVVSIFSRSMAPFASNLTKILFILILLMLLVSLVTNKFNSFDILWSLSCSILCVLVNGIKGNLLLYLVIIAFSMRNSNVFLLVKYTSITILFTLILILSLTKIGYIPNLQFIRNGVLRSSLGMRFPLIFGSYVFSFSSLITLLMWKKYPKRLIFILLILAIFLSKITNSRNDSFSILLLVLVVLLQKLPNKVLEKICEVCVNIVFLCSFCVPFITKIFPYNSFEYNILDKLSTGRLYYQNILCNFYTPKILGQKINEVGLGGTTSSVNNYFYIDSSMTRFMFLGGIIFFILYLFAWYRCINKQIKKKLYLFALVFIIIWLNGFLEDSMANPTTGFLVAFLLIDNYSAYKEAVDLE